MTDSNRSWLITGASRGFGLAFTRAVLGRGERVLATVRDEADGAAIASLGSGDRLKVSRFDAEVADDAARIVREAEAAFGGIDVVVNNAGYGQFGAFEELDDELVRRQLDINLLAPMRVTRAALPGMRRRGRGHIVQISSIGGVGAFPMLSAYHASKWALEGVSESLAAEVAEYGIRVTLVEPGAYATDWGGSSARRAAPLPAYDDLRDRLAARAPAAGADPEAAAQALLAIADHPEPPLRVLFGLGAWDRAHDITAGRIATWESGREITEISDGA